MSQHDFGELRGLLEQRPSVVAFENLLYFLDYHAKRDGSGRVRREWLPYAFERLAQSWPDATRECPKKLLERYESGEAFWAPLVRSLNFERERLAKKRTERILAATHMKDVTHVNLRSCHVNWTQLEALAERAPFGQLDFLDFRKTSKIKRAEEEHLAAFFASNMLKGVRSLSFRDWMTLDVRGLDLFMDHFPLEGLERLNLDGGKAVISPRQFDRMLKTGKLYQLEELSFDNLGDLGMSTGMLGVLARHDGLSNLRKLTVSGCHTRDIEAFADATHFAHIEELHLRSIHDAYDAMVPLLTLKKLPALRKLTLHFTDVGLASDWDSRQQAMLDRIASSGAFEQLELLSLSFEHGLPDPTTLFTKGGERMCKLSTLRWDCRSYATTLEQRVAHLEHLVHGLAQVPFERLHGLHLGVAWHRSATWPDGALSVLKRSGWFAKLDTFTLACDGCDPEDVLALLGGEGAPMLRVMSPGMSLRDENLERFLERVDLSRLEVLGGLHDSKSLTRFIEALKEARDVWRVRCVLVPDDLLDVLGEDPFREEAIQDLGLWVAADTGERVAWFDL